MWRRISAHLQIVYQCRSLLIPPKRYQTKSSSSYQFTFIFNFSCKELQDMENTEGPFGTKEAPAFVKSIYDKRIVGCPGGRGKDEHDVVWFWLEKGKPHQCSTCSQYFALKVVLPGEYPDEVDSQPDRS